MSSRFSRPNSRFSRPIICRPAPPDFDRPLPPFQSWELIAHVYWRDLLGTDPCTLTGTLRMTPGPTPYTWEGLLPGKVYDLEAGFAWLTPQPLGYFALTLLLAGTPVWTYDVTNVPISPAIPFNSGLVHVAPPSPSLDCFLTILS